MDANPRSALDMLTSLSLVVCLLSRGAVSIRQWAWARTTSSGLFNLEHPVPGDDGYDCKKVAMLAEFIDLNRHEIIGRCRAKVAARLPSPVLAVEIDHGVPVFLDQLVDALRSGVPKGPEIDKVAVKHGRDLLLQGFTVSQVVHDYGDVCQTITEMALEKNALITTTDFRTLNSCLDD